jgi:D-alanyl-D-alanine carboxypeptidase
MAELSVPGAVVLIRTPTGEYRDAFGTRRVRADDPVQVGDYFRVGSNTKTMTGTVVLQLAQEGRIALSDPVSKYRPEVPGGARITIEQLLDMRSGLFNYTELESVNRTLDEDPTKVWRPQELVSLGLAQPPYFPPGQGFHYSNTNTVLLGLIVEQLTGQQLGTVFQQRIFTPLGLRNTLLPPITSNAIPDTHPQGYLFGTNVSTMTDAALPPDQQVAARNRTLQPNDVTELNPSWAWAAGAAISTAEDLATYVKPLVAGGLLDDAMQKQRLDSLAPTDPADPNSASYGLALARFGPMIGHDGALPGYQSFMGYDPAAGNTLIVLTNLQNAPDGTQVANDIARRLIPLL